MKPEQLEKFVAERLEDCDNALGRARRIAWESRQAGGEFGERYVEPALDNLITAIDSLRAVTRRLVLSRATSS